MSFLRIIQISDIHINKKDKTINGALTRRNFLNLINGIDFRNVDILVLSGDLAYRENDESYEWIKDQLNRLGIEYCILSGNHDKPRELAEVFGLKYQLRQGRLFYHKEIKGNYIFFLDSSKNRIRLFQLKWLLEKSSKINGEALLFMHHPPVLCGCRYMDRKYPLKNKDIVMEYLQKCKNIRRIFCGHYHTEKLVKEEGKEIYLTPSTFFQLNNEADYMKIESIIPGYRLIEWDRNSFNTVVNYIG